MDVSTAGCNFSTTPLYLTSLGGDSHYGTTGVTSIYFAANNSFRVYLRFSSGAALTPALANSYGWHVNWAAINGTVQAVKKYYDAGGTRIAMRDNGQLRWLLGDHLGSTSYAATGTTESGEVRYKPFGVTRYTSGSIPTTYRYTGQREEASLGLYYYGARWYDPALGRFIQPDTIVPDPGEAKAFDRYSYVNNNPLKYNDPTGHCATLGNGSPDLDNDAGCWNAADEWFATFGPAGYENAADWRKYFASNASITEDVLRGGLYNYWHPIFQQSGVYHPLYNPPPQMHEGPPPPNYVEAFHKRFGQMLTLCAKAVNGACGVSTGLNYQAAIVGGRVSLDGYVDKDGTRMYYWTPAIGAQFSLEPLGLSGSNSYIVAPGAKADSFGGLGASSGGSITIVMGLGVDLVSTVTNMGPQPIGISVGTQTGINAEVHSFMSYSFVLYDSRQR